MKYTHKLILIPLVLLAACNEDPAPTGAALLPDSDLVDIVSYNSNDDAAAPVSSTYFRANKGEPATTIWLGETPQYRSELMLRWYNFSEPIGDAGTIVETKLVLHTAQNVFGGQPGSIAFDVLEITEEVSIADVTSESMGSIATAAEPRGSYAGTDSAITVALDTAMVREWMRRYTRNVNASTSNAGPEPYGVKIVPKGMSHLQGFVSGNALANIPELIMIVDRDGERDTLRGLSPRDTYAASGPDYSAQPLSVHGGISYRGRLTFDLGTIPPGSIVNYAKLTLTRNPTDEVRSSLGIDSVLVFEALSSTVDSLSISSSICQPTSENPDAYVAEGTIHTATLLLAVQRWINSPDLNHGLIITKVLESRDLDQLHFYGGESAPGLRPRLEVFYTTKP